MLSDILRFNREAPHELTNGLTDSMSVARYFTTKGYGPGFRDHYLLPLGASLWSCPAERFGEFSMRFVIEFLHNHGMLRVNGRPVWKTVVGGSRQYVRRLTKEFRDRIRLNTPVQSVARRGQHVDVRLPDNSVERFDEVILAAHADQSLQLMENLDEDERHTLSSFPYQHNEAVLHTDTRLLPDRRAAWASWNYRIPSSRTSRVAVTYNMNLLQGLDSEQTYCVSLNQTAAIDRTRIVKRISYPHPLFIPGRDAAQAKHPAMIRRGGISYCGAYWGFGFHEDGVRSALAVCDAFDMSLPR